MDVTLFEIHLPDAQFNAPFASGQSSEETESTEESSSEDSGGSRLRPFIALAVLVGLALAARYLRSSAGVEEEEPLDISA